MSKLQDLRAAIMAADPKIEADQLFTFIRDGNVTDTGAGIRYEGTAVVVVTDWAGSPHPIARALALWLRTFENAATDALQFEVDLISNTMVDLNFSLPFSEVVVFEGDQFAECAGPVPNPQNFFPP